MALVFRGNQAYELLNVHNQLYLLECYKAAGVRISSKVLRRMYERIFINDVRNNLDPLFPQHIQAGFDTIERLRVQTRLSLINNDISRQTCGNILCYLDGRRAGFTLGIDTSYLRL